MLNVILMVLKVIGITLAILVGILLLLTALILWVPVRYRILAAKQEEIYAKVKISWFFRFAYVLIRYEDSKLLYIIRILGIPIYDSRKPKKKKPKKENKTKVKKRKIKKRKVKKVKTSHQNKIETKSEKTTSVIQVEKMKETQDSSTSKIKSTDEITKTIEVTKTIKSSEVIQLDQEENNEELKSVRKGMKYRIKQIINIIHSIPSKIRNFIMVWKEKISKILLLIKKVSAYPKKFKDFLMDEENKAGIQIVIQTIKDLLKHLKPKRVEGELIFGFDDPCTTGQALGAISVVYAFISPKRFQVIPDFQENRLEGRIDARGRICTFTVLRIVIRLLRDEHFKTLKERIDNFKEE